MRSCVCVYLWVRACVFCVCVFVYDYGGLKDEMIRDRLVLGIRNTALLQQLQLNAELTLDKAKTKVRQREAVGKQQRELKGESEAAISLEEIRIREHFKSMRPQAQSYPQKDQDVKTIE